MSLSELATAEVATNFTKIMTNIQTMVVWPIFAGLVVIMVVYAGILFVTASGDPSKIATGKKAILWASIGAAIGIAAYGIIALLKDILRA